MPLYMYMLTCLSVYHDNSNFNIIKYLNLNIMKYMNMAQSSSTSNITLSMSWSLCDFEIFLHLPQYKQSSSLTHVVLCNTDSHC